MLWTWEAKPRKLQSQWRNCSNHVFSSSTRFLHPQLFGKCTIFPNVTSKEKWTVKLPTSVQDWHKIQPHHPFFHFLTCSLYLFLGRALLCPPPLPLLSTTPLFLFHRSSMYNLVPMVKKKSTCNNSQLLLGDPYSISTDVLLKTRTLALFIPFWEECCCDLPSVSFLQIIRVYLCTYGQKSTCNNSPAVCGWPLFNFDRCSPQNEDSTHTGSSYPHLYILIVTLKGHEDRKVKSQQQTYSDGS